MIRLKSASLLGLALCAALVSHPGWAQRPDRWALHAVPADAASRDGWRTVANHIHTAESHDARASLDELVADAGRRGLDALVLTDHNSTAACVPEALLPHEEESGITLIPGQEWSSRRWGHAGLLGYAEKAVQEADGVERALGAAQEAGALAIANHPTHWGLTWQPGLMDARLGGVEVWNGFWGNPLAQNEAALALWDDALRQGRRLSAIGGADYHGYFYARIDQAVNRVQVTAPGREGIMEGFRMGRVQIAASPRAAWLDLTVDGHGLGAVVPAGGAHRLRVAVHGGKGLELRLVTRDGVMVRRRLASDREAFEAQFVGDAGISDFVRAELREGAPSWSSVQVIANPVYLEAAVPEARISHRDGRDAGP